MWVWLIIGILLLAAFVVVLLGLGLGSRLLVAVIMFLAGLGVDWLSSYHHGPVLLEITARDGGMVCSTRKYLELRVYESGRIEGDAFKGLCAPVSLGFFMRHKGRLNINQIAELKSVLHQSELSAVKDSYPQFVMYDDSGTSEVILFEHQGQRKSIALVNSDPDNSENVENYPPSLIKLLREAKQVRERLGLSN
jgi:hypothetical protein